MSVATYGQARRDAAIIAAAHRNAENAPLLEARVRDRIAVLLARRKGGA